MSHSDPQKNGPSPQEAREYWDAAAADFDEQPDHGLRDTDVRAAWTALLKTWLPAKSSLVLDVGCGTGSLSVVMAGLGHTVTGIDISPAMLALAQEKARSAARRMVFRVMDAAAPDFPAESFNVLVCRHLLWALPDPGEVLERWAKMLKPRGRMILIEGYWSSGGGLHACQLPLILPASVAQVSVQALSDNPALWGRPVTDERYALIADLR